jgi:hypothetical protein
MFVAVISVRLAAVHAKRNLSCFDSLAAKHKYEQLLRQARAACCFDLDANIRKQACCRTLSALAAALAVELLDALEELILRLGAKAYPEQQLNLQSIQPRIQLRQASERMLTMQLECKPDRPAKNVHLD